MPTTTPADPVVEEDRVCPECSSEHLVRDYTRGELVCDSCGLVISESAIDEGPEWAAYSVEENDRLARTGAPRSYVAGASGLTTVIPLANKDARGNTIPLREREKFYRMRKLQRHSGHSRPGERSLPETIRSLDRVASLMGLPRPVKDEAGFICKKALEKGLVRGRSIEAIVAAAVYAACRIDGVPRTLDELQQVTGVRKKTIGKAYGALLRTLTASSSWRGSCSSSSCREVARRKSARRLKVLRRKCRERVLSRGIWRKGLIRCSCVPHFVIGPRGAIDDPEGHASDPSLPLNPELENSQEGSRLWA